VPVALQSATRSPQLSSTSQLSFTSQLAALSALRERLDGFTAPLVAHEAISLWEEPHPTVWRLEQAQSPLWEDSDEEQAPASEGLNGFTTPLVPQQATPLWGAPCPIAWRLDQAEASLWEDSEEAQAPAWDRASLNELISELNTAGRCHSPLPDLAAAGLWST
jgi:hypothetical protein